MSRSSVVDLKKTSNGRICEPAKTELATDLQKSAELRQLLTYWVHERGYSIKTVTHSLETHSHRIIGMTLALFCITNVFSGVGSDREDERARPSVSETVDLVAEDVFAELQKEIEDLSKFNPQPGTKSMHTVVLDTSRTELAKAKEISKSIKESTECLDHKVAFIRRLLKTPDSRE